MSAGQDESAFRTACAGVPAPISSRPPPMVSRGEAAGSSRPLRPGLDRPVQDYFREHFSIVFSGFLDSIAFTAAFKTVGADRMMFAADYPFLDSAETRKFLDELPVSGSDREKIAHTNAERLLKLGG